MGAASDVPEEVREKALITLEATYRGIHSATCKGHDFDGVYLAYCRKNRIEDGVGGLYAILGAVPTLFSIYPVNGKSTAHLDGYENIVDEFGQKTRVGKWDGKPIDTDFAYTMLTTQFK